MRIYTTQKELDQDLDVNGNLNIGDNVKIEFHCLIPCDITAMDITARDIRAIGNIKAWVIEAGDITAVGSIDARDISYFALCLAYHSLRYKKIKGRRENAMHLCLDFKDVTGE